MKKFVVSVSLALALFADTNSSTLVNPLQNAKMVATLIELEQLKPVIRIEDIFAFLQKHDLIEIKKADDLIEDTFVEDELLFADGSDSNNPNIENIFELPELIETSDSLASWGYWSDEQPKDIILQNSNYYIISKDKTASEFIQNLINLIEVEKSAYISSEFFGEVLDGESSQKIENLKAKIGFDIGALDIAISRDSYIYFDVNTQSWHLENLDGVASSEGFFIDKFDSVGDVRVDSGYIDGAFLGKDATQIAALFEFLGDKKIASGGFFATK